MAKLRLATVWLGGCSGCHMSFLDMDEWLIELAARADLVYSPLADVKDYPDNVDVALVEGAVANEENLDMARRVRACDEIEGAHTWDVAGRGGNARVITDMAQPWGESATCTSCGKCVAACPTGALFRQGSTVAEAQHDKGRLAALITAREKKQWVF